MTEERKWVEYTAAPTPRGSGGLYASLNSRGIIVLNRKAYGAIGEPEAVVFLFDIDNLSIGLKPCDLLMPNAFSVNQRGGARPRP